MRGISGAGKSTFIKKNYPKAVVCSADNFFINEDGVYVFDPKKIKEAHQFCQKVFFDAVESSQALVVVDNTNTQLWEFKTYIDVAKEHQYKISVIRIVIDPKKAAERNRHGVPEEVVVRMSSRFENFPGETIVSAIFKV
jgi:predicted kinase